MASKKEDANLAKKLKKDERKKIALRMCADYDTDVQGRKPWEDRRNRFYKLWMTQRDAKNSPWPGASNVCLPILAIACNQFHARSYQAMFTPAEFVRTMPVGPNDVRRSRSVANLMNWQFLYDIPNYEDNKDKLLLGVPINGGGNTKTTWDFDNERPDVEYVTAMDLILPYRTRDLETARRITHRLRKHYDELEMRAGRKKDHYIDFDKVAKTSSYAADEPDLEQTKDDTEVDTFDTEERPHLILEQYRFWKMPWDNEMVPYTFTVDYESRTLLRVVDRVLSAKGNTYIFNPFVTYEFFPNPEGFYPFGFGHFLEQLNEMANTAFNQIFDSGRLSNQPFGFYGRRAGIKRRELKLWPGRMEEVEDASQLFFPSMQRVDQVLFQVLGLIEQYSQQFTSTGDYLLGRESRGTKTPTASGTLAIIEQGLVLYNVMIKRLFRSLKKEFQKVYLLNQMNLPEKKQYVILENNDFGFPVAKRNDFDGRMHIIPVGDPTYASKLTRRQEAQEILAGVMSNPMIIANPKIQVLDQTVVYEAYKTWLETFERKDYMKLLPKKAPAAGDPEMENAAIFQGDEVETSPADDHIAHLEAHERFKKSPLYAEMDQDAKDKLDEHIKDHKAKFHATLSSRQQLGANVPTPMPVNGQPPQGPPAEMEGAPPGAQAAPPQEVPPEEPVPVGGNGDIGG